MSSRARSVLVLVLSMSLAGVPAAPQEPAPDHEAARAPERGARGDRLRPIVAADVVHNDELIVNGSGACIGLGCALGDADGLGGVRIKSTSPVIWLEDTGGGVSGTHDWFIMANGAFAENSFKILDLDAGTTPFTIAGSAPSNSIYVTSGGSVGVGTTAPASKLHVSGGSIRVSSGSFIDDGVTLNVPDYVFEPGYELLPLDELAEFLRREKHLPNVPKAEEIKASGLNLSQFQMLLLEKVEELTLYTLAQQADLTSQQATLSELRGENEDLRERLAALEGLLGDTQAP